MLILIYTIDSMTNYLYNILVINEQTDQLVPCLSGLRRLTTVILMRCGFRGVGSNPRNRYICFNCNYLFLLFLSYLLSAGVLFQVLHVHFYLFSNQSVNDTPFWYHFLRKQNPFVDYLFFFNRYIYVYMYVLFIKPMVSGVGCDFCLWLFLDFSVYLFFY